MRKLIIISAALIAALVFSACGGHHQPSQYSKVVHHATQRRAYIPQNDVEFNNYNNAQKLYDDPSTIIWCTTTWGNANSPIVTVPVAGKLTSSSTTFFNPTDFEFSGDTGVTTFPARSVDGMFHPNPPQYRYGFTPGGQYVDFFNMPTLCTTALTKFQRSSTKVTISIDTAGERAQKQAEAVLRAGLDPVSHQVSKASQAKAQAILTGAGLG